MIDPKLKTLGFKQMHKIQIHAMHEMVSTALTLAAMTEEDEILEEVEAQCDEFVRLFGGVGVSVKVETH